MGWHKRPRPLRSILASAVIAATSSTAPAPAHADIAPASASAPRHTATASITEKATDAEDVTPPRPPPRPSRRPRPISGHRKALALGGAFVPGLVAHGAGHFIAGDPQTGLRLLAIEGIGVGIAGGSLGVVAATGASRRFSGPLITLTMAGAGLFLISFLSDLYGVLAPEGGTGSPALSAPWVETQLGLRYVYNPVFAYRSFLVQAVDLRWGPLRLSPSGWFALDDRNARLRALAAYRITGPRPAGSESEPARDGSYLDVEGAITHHRYGSEGFAITSGELALHGRLDMIRVSPSLAGSFAELTGGAAVDSDEYFGVTSEGNTFLLGRFGFGVYVGRPSYPRGEVMVYYDHRHDDFAAGWKMTGIGSGVGGHAGLEGKLYFNDQWGALAEAQVGSAYLGGVSILFRYGGSQ